MGMATRAAIADALDRGRSVAGYAGRCGRMGTTAAQRIARTTLAGLAGGGPRLARRDRGRTRGGAGHDSPPVGRRSPVRPDRGGHPCRRRGPGGLVDALERARCRGVRAAAHPPGRPGGRWRRAAARRRSSATTAGSSSRRSTRSTASWRSCATPRRSAPRGRRRRPRHRRRAAPAAASSPTSSRPSTVHRSGRGVPAGGGGARRVLFPCADLAPDTIPDGLGQQGLGLATGGGLSHGAAPGAGAGDPGAASARPTR